MKLLQEIWILGALSLAACGGDDGNSGPCASSQQGTAQCGGTVVRTCDGASWVDGVDCAATSQICSQAADAATCIDTCTVAQAGYQRCASAAIQSCNGAGWLELTDCSASSQTCAQTDNSACCIADAACTSALAGHSRCYCDTWQTCNGGSWVYTKDCRTTNQKCQPVPALPSVVECKTP